MSRRVLRSYYARITYNEDKGKNDIKNDNAKDEYERDHASSDDTRNSMAITDSRVTSLLERTLN